MALKLNGSNDLNTPGVSGSEQDSGFRASTDSAQVVANGKVVLDGLETQTKINCNNNTEIDITSGQTKFNCNGNDNVMFTDNVVAIAGTDPTIEFKYGDDIDRAFGTPVLGNMDWRIVSSNPDPGDAELSFVAKDTDGTDFKALVLKANAGSGEINFEKSVKVNSNYLQVGPTHKLLYDTTDQVLYFKSNNDFMFTTDSNTVSVEIDQSEGRLFCIDNIYGGRRQSSYRSGEHGVYCHAGGSGSFTYIFGRNVADSSYVYQADVSTPRIEFRANGNGYFDGGADMGTADYAEMFEWADGNPNNEDRRGHSVVLEGDKIRIATGSDLTHTIIGIVSVEPGILGDSKSLNWHGEWLRDEFGAKVEVDVEYLVWNSPNEPKPTASTRLSPEKRVPSSEVGTGSELDKSIPDYARQDNIRQIYKQLVPNPDYDPSMEYVARRERKEWDPVGLLGKLPLKNTEPRGDRWFKLKKLSDNLDLWLVR